MSERERMVQEERKRKRETREQYERLQTDVTYQDGQAWDRESPSTLSGTDCDFLITTRS